ncbi:MAG TPA: thioredoxin-disulfide reductase [Candidatus Binatia bacterium]|nr:thioredoxin-disulfide reductase [Candidatus Binatia bacterium]
MNHYKVIIIGSGPAGLTAGVYAARANLSPLIIGGLTFGGQLMLTTEVENFPGFPEGIQGPDLMQKMIAQAERFGAKVLYDDALKVDLSSKPFKIEVGKDIYTADALIVASGASSLWLGIPSEERFRGKGVSSCATCDGFFFKDKEIIVVGGGDSAMEEASYLTKFASKVTIIHRRDQFRASKIMQDRVLNNPKISVMYNTTVEEFTGEEKLGGVKLKDVNTGEVKEMKIEGAFIAIGHNPNTSLFKDQIELDEKGYVKKSGRDTHFPMATSVPGVFVAGDVHDHHYRQAITAAGMGCMAAIDAERYLGLDHG